MTVADPILAKPSGRIVFAGLPNKIFASPNFQRFISKVPILRRVARQEGEALFDLVMGFVQSQALYALVKLKTLEHLLDGPLSLEALADRACVPIVRMEILLQAGVALKLLRRHRRGRYGLARRGAALLGVPGLAQMILHHDHFYQDMADPVALLRDQVDTKLAQFWPYVFGATGAAPQSVTDEYSRLMEQSQALVAADTLKMVPLKGAETLLDIGGGTGAFLAHVARQYPALNLNIFDLAQVGPAAQNRLAEQGLSDRISFHGGSFRSDPLPLEADVISLIRVLYDHSDETVQALLKKTYEALPVGGQLIISEPMAGGAAPTRPGDVYFAFYTMAMNTGKARSVAQISALCKEAGFVDIKAPKAPRPFITSAVTARKAR